ncbi:MAG: hypothetical protein ACE149_01175 [Armatimonadota bacterium]
MARLLAVCFIVLCIATGFAYSQDEGAAPAQDQAAAPASLADALWAPSTGQLAFWIDEGISAAGADLDFFDLPVLDRTTWSTSDGIPLADDRSFRFGAVMTPELAASVLGYGISWEEDTWAAIQEDPDKVSSDLAAALGGVLSGGPIYIIAAVSGAQYDDMLAAVYYEGQWRSLRLTPWGTVSDYTPDSLDQATSDPLWAARYLITQESAELPLQPADQVYVYLLTWQRNASTQLDADFQQELPQPEWTDPKRARLVLGDADLLAWVDFDVIG